MWRGASLSRSRRAPRHWPAPRGSSPASAGRDPGTAPTGAARAGPHRRRAPPPAPPTPPPRPRCPAAAAGLGRGERALSPTSPSPSLVPHSELPPSTLFSLSLGPPDQMGMSFPCPCHFRASRTNKGFRSSGFCGYIRPDTIAADCHYPTSPILHPSLYPGPLLGDFCSGPHQRGKYVSRPLALGCAM